MISKRICNYSEFLLNESILNESTLYMSDRFKKMISSMPSMMSNMILNKELTDIKDDITFVDLYDDDYGKLKFTRIRNINKLLDENDLGSLDVDNLPEDIYPSLIKKFSEENSDKFNEIGLGKFIRKILGENITDRDIEIYTDRVKSYHKKKENKYVFKLVEFSDESGWQRYFNSSFMKVNSEIHKSCMNDNLRLLQLYSRLNAKLLTLTNDTNNLILGRAIIWDVSDNDELDFDFFMDKIYIGASWVTQFFKNYAIKNKWAYKETQDYFNKKGVVFNGETKDVEMVVKCDVKGISKFPYMDTFTYLIEDEYLSNFDKKGIKNTKVLSQTDGTYGNRNKNK